MFVQPCHQVQYLIHPNNFSAASFVFGLQSPYSKIFSFVCLSAGLEAESLDNNLSSGSQSSEGGTGHKNNIMKSQRDNFKRSSSNLLTFKRSSQIWFSLCNLFIISHARQDTKITPWKAKEIILRLELELELELVSESQNLTW